MVRLAICLISSDRHELTWRTAESFVKHNGWSAGAPFDVHMFHGDDASLDRRNVSIADHFGFKTLIETRPNKRLGANGMRQALVREVVATCEPSHVLILENDWESVRPVPWEGVHYYMQRPEFYCVRLYGKNKDREGLRPAGADHAGKGHIPVAWVEGAVVGFEEADIHWGAPPAITRVEEFLKIHEGTYADSKVMRRCGQLDKLTARVTENVVYHIGYDRTPGFRR